MEASYNRSGRCVCTSASSASWANTIFGDLDHEPVVLAQVEARELADPAQALAQRVRVDVERLGGRADGAAAAQELLQRPNSEVDRCRS